MFDNIVVAIDDVDSPALIDAAIHQARAFGSKLWLIHVTFPDPDFVGYDPGPQYIRDDRAKTIKQEHRYLQELAEKIETNEGISTHALLIQGPTVDTLLKEAMDLKADLIIIGNEDHSFMYKALIGETTSKVVKRAKIPIMVIPMLSGDSDK
ncbi:universal stress protein [Mangrovivirga sp. M17]|uniref:Universal stress protein n=1 Tax=Mangrovivirga halotolerans TaxID=2993936 RepID=A0ABT3RN82_9BACT|nr:universal stress protein [Mangrovivirga halotolerans]MCX2742717.1 universal stress protein [Mangrovivirga halotolerans]